MAIEGIHSSAEHHFLNTLERLKENPKGWVVVHFDRSKSVRHGTLMKNLNDLGSILAAEQAKGQILMEDLSKACEGIARGYAYVFPDGDVIGLMMVRNEAEHGIFDAAYKKIAKGKEAGSSRTYVLATEFRKMEKIAEAKLFARHRFDAYETMSDRYKRESIPNRRARNEHPKVLFVEDDRFTAAYAANILSKDYDLTICRSGEEALTAYIEQAPDIVFLDIHLPGLDGHETLKGLYAIDPSAFVVMLSVDTVKENIMQASKFGARKFLKKPFSKERLIHTVQTSPYVKEHHLLGFSGGESRVH